MRPLAASILLLVPAGLASGRDTDDWIDFTPKGGKFTIKMPAQPEEKTLEVETTVGKVMMQRYWAYGSDGIFTVSYSDFRDGALDLDDPQGQIDNFVRGFFRGMKGKQDSSKNLKLHKKYPGREVRYTDPGSGDKGLVRFYLVGNRLYSLQVRGSPEFMAGKDVDTYLDSFKVFE
jgi:hypothetical protein